jgi:hypothetical protein
LRDKDNPGQPDADNPEALDASHSDTANTDNAGVPDDDNAESAGTDHPEASEADNLDRAAFEEFLPMFEPRAAINEYLARPKLEYTQLGKDAAERMRHYIASPKFQEDALASARDGLERMRREFSVLGLNMQPKARRAIQANEEWIQADAKERAALAQGDETTAAEQEQTKAKIDQELTLIDVMLAVSASTAAMAKSTTEMAKSTAASAQSLAEMESARKLAEKDHQRQTLFNNIMALFGILLALGSIGVGIAMPFVEHAHINPPQPTPSPSVIVIERSDLTVPPLLRRITG